MRRAIVGLDLSLTSTGIATPDGVWRIRSKQVGMARCDDIAATILDAAPIMCAPLFMIEGYSYGRPNQAHQLGELGGIVRYALWRRLIPWVDVPPARLKRYATGKGNANKEEMLAAAIRRLDYQGSSNDEADALWLRALGCDAYGEPLCEMPATHRTVIDKIDWPGK